MRFRLSELCLGTVITAAVASSAWAGPALDDASAQPSAAATDPSVAANPPEDPANKVEYGLGIRLRSVHVPQSVLVCSSTGQPAGQATSGSAWI